MNVVVTGKNYLGKVFSQYAYPFSFPVGQGTGTTSQFQKLPLTWGDIAFYPPYIIPVVALPIVALFFVWKGLN